MFAFLRRAQPSQAQVNQQSIQVAPGESLLQAALRHGLDFPHGCRVGACASCKCQLRAGQVRELTDSSYVLSAAERAAGYILACQSVPQGDIRVSLAEPVRQVAGQIIGQRALTRDIMHLQVQLAEPLDYRGGQYAELCLDSLPGVWRCYSFASPASPDGQVSFFIRRLANGRFSARLHDDLRGTGLSLRGPRGECYLRAGHGPLLLVAAGSGLAPLLALLQEALADGCQRPVRLLFGARRQGDLYALEQIAQLARQWPGTFSFTPVLSQEPCDSNWRGARGSLLAQLPQPTSSDTQAYLCGPVGLVEDVSQHLQRQGLAAAQIHSDPFSPASD